MTNNCACLSIPLSILSAFIIRKHIFGFIHLRYSGVKSIWKVSGSDGKRGKGRRPEEMSVLWSVVGLQYGKIW